MIVPSASARTTADGAARAAQPDPSGSDLRILIWFAEPGRIHRVAALGRRRNRLERSPVLPRFEHGFPSGRLVELLLARRFGAWIGRASADLLDEIGGDRRVHFWSGFGHAQIVDLVAHRLAFGVEWIVWGLALEPFRTRTPKGPFFCPTFFASAQRLTRNSRAQPNQRTCDSTRILDRGKTRNLAAEIPRAPPFPRSV